MHLQEWELFVYLVIVESPRLKKNKKLIDAFIFVFYFLVGRSTSCFNC
jgi:hypothetical protein